MAASLAHRGPDGEGLWLEPDAGIAFCHRRLSIVDLSPLGAQPMRSASGRFIITFNGEIYNYRQLRTELSGYGHSFRGGSDTEVLLAALEHWGVHGALQRCRGMLAFGLWDDTERVLWLARDRFGEKPLYFGEFAGSSGRTLVFASELKALRRHSAWKAEVDRDALALFLRRDFIPAPHTIFGGVRKLRPGCTLRIHAGADGVLRVEEREYWQPAHIAPASRMGAGARTGAGESPSEAEALANVNAALEESIRLQMVADVPVGAFLSGGIDSSLVVALMQRASSQPVRTFSIGFEEEQFNEAPFARRVANHLGTRHTELIVTSKDALDVIPRLARIYDEPFADSSQIPTFLVSSLARRDVTVALSGDAGDELFGGYSRYMEVRDRWRYLQRAPASLRSFAARTLESIPAWALGPATAPLRVLSRLRGRQQTPDRIQERAHAWGARSLPELYDAMTSYWQPSSRLVLGVGAEWGDGGDGGGTSPGAGEGGDAGGTGPGAGEGGEAGGGVGGSADSVGASALAHMMYSDTRRYLPDDILVKVDRAAMAVSLETRVPLLDPEVARAAWSIPASIHLKDGRGKWVLRTLLERHVPREMFDRPKTGFAVPVDRWLRHELRDWAAGLLDPARLRREGYFAPGVIERRWRQHLKGQTNWSAHLWGVLMFQAWLEDFQRADTPAAVFPELRRSPAVPNPPVAVAVMR